MTHVVVDSSLLEMFRHAVHQVQWSINAIQPPVTPISRVPLEAPSQLGQMQPLARSRQLQVRVLLHILPADVRVGLAGVIAAEVGAVCARREHGGGVGC